MRRSSWRGAGLRLVFLPWLAVSFALTGCPLSDNYSLMSDDEAGGGAGASANGGLAGMLGTSGSNDFGGSSGSSSAGRTNGGAQSGGTGGNSAGNATGGGARAGAPEAGEAGQSVGGGEAGGNGGGTSGTGGADTGGGASGYAGSSSAGFAGSGGTGGATTGSGGASGNASSGGASGYAGAGGMCSASQCSNTCCGVSCVDTTRDYANCGGCGVVCKSPRSCMSSQCSSGWVGMSTPPVGFVARWRAAAVAMGPQVFIWGGSDSSSVVLDSGAIYDTRNDSWSLIAKDANTPTARVFATAVWTGSVVVVFGGSDATGATPYKDGAIYDPAKNAWSAIAQATHQRSMPLGYWDGTRAVFYGGINGSAAAVAGADRFDLTTWTSSTPTGDPGAILNFASGWDGDTVLLQGGQLAGVRTDKVATYTSTSDTWTTPVKSLTARSNAFGAWDGSRFVVWGGRNDVGLLNDGKYFSGTAWVTLSTQGAPTARLSIQRRQGWLFETAPGQIALFGGQTSLVGQGTFTNAGYTYDVVNAKWATADSWPSAETHDYGVAVWTGDEFVLWGGRSGNGTSPASTLTGERWAP